MRHRVSIALSALAALAMLAAALPAPSNAQTMGYGEAMTRLVAACGADIETHCKGVRPGNARVQACMTENSSSLSEECVATIELAYLGITLRQNAQAAVLELCAEDVRRVCRGYEPGNGRQLRCLLLEHRQVSDACLEAIDLAGWD